MELTDAIRRRRMRRAYDPDRPVPREVLDGLMDLAVRAPSAGYSQGWRFLILDDITSRSAFWAASVDGEDDP
ncbi:MAG: nitroreductase family protein, partial [Jatrophihabitantaceae bacterium]